ncbi:MAG: MBL fold metallo-hydrolase, partial [Candidatus Aenigmarchaeota archaeon]|nr:MBL fold metallo-hydrolase [Candidatus Aenigmarchaeota archaeon]
EFAKHMDVDDAIKFAKYIKPELCIIQHFGMGMIRAGPWTQAERIEKETGIKTVAARDGQIFDFLEKGAKTEGLEKFKKD